MKKIDIKGLNDASDKRQSIIDCLFQHLPPVIGQPFF